MLKSSRDWTTNVYITARWYDLLWGRHVIILIFYPSCIQKRTIINTLYRTEVGKELDNIPEKYKTIELWFPFATKSNSKFNTTIHHAQQKNGHNLWHRVPEDSTVTKHTLNSHSECCHIVKRCSRLLSPYRRMYGFRWTYYWGWGKGWWPCGWLALAHLRKNRNSPSRLLLRKPQAYWIGGLDPLAPTQCLRMRV